MVNSSGGGGGGGAVAVACYPFQYWGRENYEIWKFDPGNKKYLQVQYCIYVPSVISVEGVDTKNILKCLKNIDLTNKQYCYKGVIWYTNS